MNSLCHFIPLVAITLRRILMRKKRKWLMVLALAVTSFVTLSGVAAAAQYPGGGILMVVIFRITIIFEIS